MFKIVEFEISGRCNQKCSYCPNSLDSRPNTEMDLSLFKKALRDLNEMSFSGRVSYSFYNEPLLSQNFDQFCLLTKKHLPNVIIDLYTNGSLLDMKRVLYLDKIGVDYFIVTRHEGVDVLPIEINYHDLPTNVQNKILIRDHQQIPKTNRGGIIKNIGPALPPVLMPCSVPNSNLVITSTGNVLPCFEDYYEKNIMGNLHDERLVNIWHSPKYKKFREDLKRCLRHLYNPCHVCNRYQFLEAEVAHRFEKELKLKNTNN